MQIKLKAIDKKTLLIYINFLKFFLKKNNYNFFFFNLPKKKKLVTFLKSPHVNKKAQEHFSLTIYKKIIIIKNINFLQLKTIIINKPKQIKLEIKKRII